MAFRQNSQRDERRRRVLCDESTSGGTWTGSVSAARAAGEPAGERSPDGPRYTDAALRDSQPRVTDFVATRSLVHMAILAALLSVVAGIIALDHYVPAWNAVLGEDALRFFDLAQPGSLGSWFSALVLAGCAAAAGLIYRIRRHRVDDYRGRYRIWLWAVGGFFLLSADAVAGLHQAVEGLLIHTTRTTLLGDGAVWWMLVWVAGFGSLGAALLYDLRPSRAATMALVTAVAGYFAAALVALDVIPSGNMAPVVLTAACVLVAHCCTFASLHAYARYVILDAEGKLPARQIVVEAKAKSDATSKAKQRKMTPRKQPTTPSAPPETRRSDLDPVPVQPQPSAQPSARLYEEYEDDDQDSRQTKRRAKKQRQPQSAGVEMTDDWEQPQQRKLSKAERKRLRKQKMLERMDDAA
ncbi:MAG: hypothetical protein IID44_07270 [Planctomycetes bacterium]|nr:hypothetical protein [Planctomycetota bacterium]